MKIRAGLIAVACILGLGVPCPLQSADSLGNIEDFIREQEAPAIYRPGSWVILPDGRRTRILEKTPGGFRTDTGIIIDPQGVIIDGENKGLAVRPEKPDDAVVIKPEEMASPEMKKPELKETPVKPVEPNREPVKVPAIVQPESKPQDEELTLAQLLPVTEVPEHGRVEKPVPEQKMPEKKTPEKKEPAKKVPEQKQTKPEKNAPQKQKPGEALRIPPDAAKSGNLSFLEGCWQGTRPEYYSKRTIRECFCFGANGKNGKRRVIDPTYNRRCIGATRATLSKNGVLSVVSSGAACSDGQRWGQAEMVCRNSGPNTPCSWVFRDAQNGRQSYQIPFIRVESCGR